MLRYYAALHAGGSLNRSSDTVTACIRIHQVAGFFRSRDALDATIDALSESGYPPISPRAAVTRRAQGLASTFRGRNPGSTPIFRLRIRYSVLGQRALLSSLARGSGFLMFIGAALSATAVIASGGSSAAARNRGTRAIVRRLRRGHVPGINP